MLEKFSLVIILMLMCICCFFHVSFAYETGTVYLKTNRESISKEEEFELIIGIESSKVAAFTSYVYFDNTKVEYISGPDYANVVGNKVICVWYDELGGSNPKSGELENLKFKAKENGNVEFSIEGEFYDEDGNLLETKFQNTSFLISDTTNDFFKEEVQNNIQNDIEPSNIETIEIEKEKIINTNLENLAVENFLLNPNFDPNITNYEIEISNEITSLNILAVPEKEDSNVKIIGNQALKEGQNLIKIIVTDKNNLSEKIYEINAIKRTIKDEKKYSKEQENNKEKLEKIYEKEKLLAEEEARG